MMSTIDWKSLDGKNLEIQVGTDKATSRESTVVVGLDRETGIAYVLHEEVNNG